jgi:hypothetical protein
MKILISNNENIDSPISLKTFIIEKYKLNNLQLSTFERFIKMNSTNQLLQYIGGVQVQAKHKSSKLSKNIF